MGDQEELFRLREKLRKLVPVRSSATTEEIVDAVVSEFKETNETIRSVRAALVPWACGEYSLMPLPDVIGEVALYVRELEEENEDLASQMSGG